MIQYLLFKGVPSVVLGGEHLPPTVNNLRQPARIKGQARLISTPQYRDWKLVVSRWLAVGVSRNIIPQIALGQSYELTFYVGMFGKELTTASDMVNREKAAIDAMVEAHILPGDSQKVIFGENFKPISAVLNPFGFAFVMVSYAAQSVRSGDIDAAALAGTSRRVIDVD